MKVIMLKDVKGVGQRGAIIEASDGYALNFLIPHKVAEQATPAKIAQHAVLLKAETEMKDKEQARMRLAIDSLRGKEFSISARSTPKGGLFKAIDAKDIARVIREQSSVTIKESYIELSKPIKQTGSHEISVKAAGAEAQVSLLVASV